MAEKSKIESVATVLGGIAAAIFIAGVFLHIRNQGLPGAVAATAGPTDSNAANGLILLPQATSGAASTGSNATGNGTCNSCGNPFYGSLALSYQAG